MEKETLRRLVLWTSFSALLGALVMGVVIEKAGGLGSVLGAVLLYPYMLIPALSAIVVRFLLGVRLGWGGVSLGKPLFYIHAVLLPAGGMLAALLVSVAAGAAAWGIPEAVRETLPPVAASPGDTALVGAILAINLTFGVIMGLPFTFGEEYGWRGTIFPALFALKPSAGVAIAVTGAVWGIWHAPIILMGYNYPQHPVAGVFVFVLFCIALGGVIAWVYASSGSVLAASVAHGALNGTAQAASIAVVPKNDLVGGAVGAISVAVFAAMALVLWLIFPPALKAPPAPERTTPQEEKAPDAPEG